MVSLTGSIATGANIISSTADSVKRMHMELGGKAPVIMFDDADIDAAVEGIRTFGFYNAGQDCTAACRIYAGRHLRALCRTPGRGGGSIKYGLQDDPTELGPLISAQHRDRVAGLVERAMAQPHIRLVTGGKAVPGNGFFFEPTVLADALQDDEIVRREVFGPVVSVTASPMRPRRWNGPTIRTTAWLRRCGPATAAAPIAWLHGCSTAAPGSTPTSCWSAKCPMAVRSIRGTARICRCTGWRTTPVCGM
jgi:hypothetical protein